jgi:hypothetical protein
VTNPWALSALQAGSVFFARLLAMGYEASTLLPGTAGGGADRQIIGVIYGIGGLHSAKAAKTISSRHKNLTKTERQVRTMRLQIRAVLSRATSAECFYSARPNGGESVIIMSEAAKLQALEILDSHGGKQAGRVFGRRISIMCCTSLWNGAMGILATSFTC